MLIEFSVTNFRSIKERQTLSMVAAKAPKEHAGYLIEGGEKRVPDLLPSVAIYGANASGKTNFIRALSFMRWFVSSSQQKMQFGELIKGAVPFLFDKKTRTEPSKFEVLFVNDGVRYQYGFSAIAEMVMEEWLFAYPKKRQQHWFSRHFDVETKKYSWEFGENFLGGKTKHENWQAATRNNGLFLSAAIQLNNEQLKPVFEWVQKKIYGIGTVDGVSVSPSFVQCRKGECEKEQVLKFTKLADPSISDIATEEMEFAQHDSFNKLPFDVREKILNSKEKHIVPIIKFMHRDSDGEDVGLDLKEESEGTQKFFSLAWPIQNVLETGSIVIIDEINSSLHPLLVRKLINVFNDRNINKNNAQLIFSTHDTSILDKDLFRRDQIWFTEKDEANSTKIYPLTDFKVRNDEAFGKGYLHGRYGAVPYFHGELFDNE